jgi:hypothetical protein
MAFFPAWRLVLPSFLPLLLSILLFLLFLRGVSCSEQLSFLCSGLALRPSRCAIRGPEVGSPEVGIAEVGSPEMGFIEIGAEVWMLRPSPGVPSCYPLSKVFQMLLVCHPFISYLTLCASARTRGGRAKLKLCGKSVLPCFCCTFQIGHRSTSTVP